jgi:two-component system, OmpR family, sensor kinase
VGVLTYLLAGRALRPVRTMTETLQHFTADAAHELRSPLSRLRAEIEISLRRPRAPSEYTETLTSCLDEVERLSQLTEELLTLAHLDAEDGTNREAPSVSLVPIIDDAMRRLRPHAERREVRLRMRDRVDEALMVRVGSGAVGLALANILDNAVKFSPPGGAVDVDVSADATNALIVVTDEGPGLVLDELPLLFDRFQRGAAAREKGEPGFGLGLAISKAVIQRQGGSISAENTGEGGARFSIRLPLAS